VDDLACVCEACGGRAVAERSGSGLLTGAWFHERPGYSGRAGRPHNVRPPVEALAQLRAAQLAEGR
jgi:hypothetical protein